jgi:hypothetical protein
MTLELDRLDHLGTSAFEGFVVRKDLVRRYAKAYPVPAYDRGCSKDRERGGSFCTVG